ncbi:hypothetical protein F5Y14DRAFT_397020 [Nemania sp. NC0429]|nr:hypothetical protein F5Y14DRAFT_397020 [Nemania sp. NC0429]
MIPKVDITDMIVGGAFLERRAFVFLLLVAPCQSAWAPAHMILRMKRLGTFRHAVTACADKTKSQRCFDFRKYPSWSRKDANHHRSSVPGLW